MNNMTMEIPKSRDYKIAIFSSGLIVLPIANAIVYKMMDLALKPTLSMFIKINNMIRSRIGEEREQQVQGAVVQVQDYLRNSNKKVACLIAMDLLTCYIMLKARRGLIDKLVVPTVCFLNNKCFSNCISEEVITALFNQEGYLDSVLVSSMPSIALRIINRGNEIRAQRHLNAREEALAFDSEVDPMDPIRLMSLARERGMDLMDIRRLVDTTMEGREIDSTEIRRLVDIALARGIDLPGLVRAVLIIRDDQEVVQDAQIREIENLEEVQEFRQEVQIRELEDSEEEQDHRIQINGHLLN